jgi:hypothetical protein
MSNRERFGEVLGLLARIVNPGVPWWVALPCNVLAGTAVVLYGTALLLHLRGKRR